MHCKEWYIMPLPSFSPGHRQQKMLAVFNEAGPVGRSTGIAFGTVAKVWLGCNKLKARDHQTWKMGERRTAAGSRRRAMPGSEGMTAKQTFSPISKNSMGMRNGPRLVWLKDLFPRYFWMQSLLPSTVHVTKKHSSWFDLVRILTIPDARETRGDNFAAKPILRFVVFSKLFDVYSKLSSSWIFCSVPCVFFRVFILISNDLRILIELGQSLVNRTGWNTATVCNSPKWWMSAARQNSHEQNC